MSYPVSKTNETLNPQYVTMPINKWDMQKIDTIPDDTITNTYCKEAVAVMCIGQTLAINAYQADITQGTGSQVRRV